MKVLGNKVLRRILGRKIKEREDGKSYITRNIIILNCLELYAC